MEQLLLGAGATLPVTVLRPGAITGPGSVHPRELWFVQRALDDRPVQFLAHKRRSRFHTSSTPNIAELVRLAADRPGTRCSTPWIRKRRRLPRSAPRSPR